MTARHKVSETPISTDKLDMEVCTCDPGEEGGVCRSIAV
jgi:hypothetical protein